MGMGGMGMGMGVGMSMGMGGMGMGMGMATSLALKNAADFDRDFIKQMIPHHRMGVMMASMAQTNSQHQQLRAMQQAMVKAHSQEIEQMTQWYRSCTAHPETRHGFVVHPRHAEILRGGQCRPPEGGELQLRRAGRA